MKTLNLYLAFLAFAAIVACRQETPPYEESTDSKEGVLIYLNRQNTASENLTIYPLQDSRTLKLSASYGGLGYPSSDIQVTLAVDTKAFDSIKAAQVAAGQTEPVMFPEGSYSFDKLTATISAGKLDSDFITMTYNPRAFDKKQNYILPVSITDAGGYKLSNAKTAVLKVPIFSPPYTEVARTGWIATADSEQTGGLENTGLASAVLDGNTATIWHTQYSGKQPVYPHWLMVDMTNSQYVAQIGLIKRQNNNNGPNKFYVEASTDGNTWIKVLDNTAINTTNNAEQKFELTKPGEYRYIKVTFVSGANSYAFLSELKVYTLAAAYR